MACEFELQKLDGKIVLFTIVKCVCSVDADACDYIKDAVIDLGKDGYEKYIFDLQHLDLVSSRFVGLVAKLHYDLSKKGRRIAILKARGMVYKSFKLAGLIDVIQFFSDQEEAINSFNE